jgi:NTP pyrophosphatase (non-canonical NTP hydrolase)
MKTEQEIVLRKAVELWGGSFQRDVLIEECAELINAVVHERRGRCSNREILEELADVYVVVYQLGLQLGLTEMFSIVDKKISRLEERVKSNDPNLGK